MKSRGFTLVELLIVIAVIGILAIAVLAALDPIEQLKKSRDTGRLSDAREMYNALTRYYASFNCYPDERDYGTSDGDAITGPCTSALFPAAPAVARNNTTAAGDTFDWSLTELIDGGELKAAFAQKQTITRGQLFIQHDATGTLRTCFHPESRAARSGGIGPLFTETLTTGGACVINAAYVADVGVDAVDQAVNCLVCVQ